MTRFDGLAALSCFLCLALGTTLSFGEDESQEPPLTYEVKLDDQTVSYREGETAEIPGMFTNPKVTITPHPDRVFPYHEMRFKYPRVFGFEAALANPQSKHWTLSGNHVKIMIFVLPKGVTTARYAEILLGNFDRKKSRITNANAEITLGTETLKGTLMQIELGSSKLAMDTYQVPTNGPYTTLFVFQDNLDKDGNHSKEYREALAGMKTSFALTSSASAESSAD